MRFGEGWCGSKEIEIDRSANIKASEALTIPTVTARNSFRIVKVGLSEYCTASQKIISAVPPPLFRGEARVIVHGKGTAKPTERSFKGKCGGAERGIVRFWKGWCGERHGVLLRGLWELQYNDSDLLRMRLRAYSERFRVRR